MPEMIQSPTGIEAPAMPTAEASPLEEATKISRDLFKKRRRALAENLLASTMEPTPREEIGISRGELTEIPTTPDRAEAKDLANTLREIDDYDTGRAEPPGGWAGTGMDYANKLDQKVDEYINRKAPGALMHITGPEVVLPEGVPAPYKWKSMGEKGFGEAAGEQLSAENIPLVGAVFTLGHAMRAKSAVDAYKNWQTTGEWKSDIFVTESAARQFLQKTKTAHDYAQARGYNIPGKIASILGPQISFWTEFALTGGMGAAARTAGAKLIGTAGKTAMRRGLARLGGGLAEATLAGAMRAGTVGLPRVASETYERMTPEYGFEGPKLVELAPGQNALTAVGKSFVDQWIQYATEGMGEPLTRGAKALAGGILGRIPGAARGRAMAGAVKEALGRVAETVPGRDAISKALVASGYSGALGESFEERLADILNALTNTDPSNFGLTEAQNTLKARLVEALTPESSQLISELIAFSIPGMGGKAYRLAARKLGQKPPQQMTGPEMHKSLVGRGVDPKLAGQIVAEILEERKQTDVERTMRRGAEAGERIDWREAIRKRAVEIQEREFAGAKQIGLPIDRKIIGEGDRFWRQAEDELKAEFEQQQRQPAGPVAPAEGAPPVAAPPAAPAVAPPPGGPAEEVPPPPAGPGPVVAPPTGAETPPAAPPAAPPAPPAAPPAIPPAPPVAPPAEKPPAAPPTAPPGAPPAAPPAAKGLEGQIADLEAEIKLVRNSVKDLPWNHPAREDAQQRISANRRLIEQYRAELKKAPPAEKPPAEKPPEAPAPPPKTARSEQQVTLLKGISTALRSAAESNRIDIYGERKPNLKSTAIDELADKIEAAIETGDPAELSKLLSGIPNVTKGISPFELVPIRSLIKDAQKAMPELALAEEPAEPKRQMPEAWEKNPLLRDITQLFWNRDELIKARNKILQDREWATSPGAKAAAYEAAEAIQARIEQITAKAEKPPAAPPAPPAEKQPAPPPTKIPIGNILARLKGSTDMVESARVAQELKKKILAAGFEIPKNLDEPIDFRPAFKGETSFDRVLQAWLRNRETEERTGRSAAHVPFFHKVFDLGAKEAPAAPPAAKPPAKVDITKMTEEELAAYLENMGKQDMKEEGISEQAQQARSELRDAMDELGAIMDKTNFAMPFGMFDPQLISASAKIISKAIKAGIYTFAELLQAVAARFGIEKARKLGPVLAYHWENLHKVDASGKMSPVGNVDEILAKLPAEAKPPVEAPPPAEVPPAAPPLTKPPEGVKIEEEGEGGKPGRPERGGLEGGAGVEAPPTEGVPAAPEGGEVVRVPSEPTGEPRTPVPAAPAAGRPAPGGVVPGGSGVHLPPGRKSSDSAPGINYRITDPGSIGKGTASSRFHKNLQAIKLLKHIESENRLATPEEQEVLAQYYGFGALPQVFDEANADWRWLREDLKETVTPEEYAALRASTINAHYTNPEYVGAIWKGLQAMGFQGGKVVEPAMGSGIFFGMMPDGVAETSRLIGVEMDSLTGRLAKQLYQNADIQVAPFQDVGMPDDHYDMFISNVPFGNIRITDSKDRELNRLGASLHDYFFAKAIKKTRPGGLIVFITSRYTLDKLQDSIRRHIADQANFVGAIRLPETAFREKAGTQVVTDIVILQRRAPGEARSGPEFINRKDVQEGGLTFQVNEYYAQHPEDILGKQAMTGTMYGGEAYTVEATPEYTAKGAIEQAISGKLATWATEGRINAQALAARETAVKTQQDPKVIEATADELRDGNITIRDGQVYQKQGTNLVQVDFPRVSSAVQRINALSEVRNATRTLLSLQISPDATDKQVEDARKRLNKVYDRVVKKWGALSSRDNSRAFEQDVDYPLLRSLETIDRDTKEVNKAPIFTERTQGAPKKITHTSNVSDALSATLSDLGRVDLDHIASLMGIDVGTLWPQLRGLVYKTPTEEIQLASQYLSGNVRNKLAEVDAILADPEAHGMTKEQAEADLRHNADALRAVQPKDLTPGQVRVRIGSPWIPADVYTDFMFHIGAGMGKVKHISVGGSWVIEDARPRSPSRFGTEAISAQKILERTLNARDIVIRYKDEEDKWHIDEEETALARAKQQAMEAEFVSRIWREEERSQRLLGIYNTEFNSLVAAQWDGSHLTFPGLISTFIPRAQQKDAVWRGLHGNTLLWHEVGFGKTFEMVAIAMEMRRLGLASKPMFVVPNPIIEQFPREFLTLYPNAKILAPTREDFTALKRRSLMNRIATGDWDAVLIPQSQFSKIRMSPARTTEFFQRQIEIVEQQIQEAQAEQPSRRGKRRRSDTVKELEKAKQRLLNMMKKLQADWQKDPGPFFDELGIDALFVDEAQAYKNLYFPTKMGRIPGVKPGDSQRPFDMLQKTDLINTTNGGRGVIFATGTPVTNSMTEAFTLQRYLQPGGLSERGLEHFDSWAASYGMVESQPEVTVTGQFRMHSRFRKFINIPELVQQLRSFADVRTAAEAGIVRPDLKGGKHQVIRSKAGKDLKRYLQTLVQRAEDIKKKVGGNDNMLVITMDGSKAAIDLRLVGINVDLPDSKLNKCVQEAYDTWEATKDYTTTDKQGKAVHLERGTQIIWCDLGLSGPFNVWEDVKKKLVAKGIPEHEIAFAPDRAAGEEARVKFADNLRAGKIRIALASSGRLGVGANVQDRIVRMHHLDAPYKPADIEQRDGRGYRYGNMNTEIAITRYVTEGSFDSYRWQLLEAKAAFIHQLMTGNLTDREAEDVGGEALSFAEVKALATGNPAMMRHVKLAAELRMLSAEQAAFEDERYDAQRKLQDLPARIRQVETEIADWKAIDETIKTRQAETKKAHDEAVAKQKEAKTKADMENARLKEEHAKAVEAAKTENKEPPPAPAKVEAEKVEVPPEVPTMVLATEAPDRSSFNQLFRKEIEKGASTNDPNWYSLFEIYGTGGSGIKGELHKEVAEHDKFYIRVTVLANKPGRRIYIDVSTEPSADHLRRIENALGAVEKTDIAPAEKQLADMKDTAADLKEKAQGTWPKNAEVQEKQTELAQITAQLQLGQTAVDLNTIEAEEEATEEREEDTGPVSSEGPTEPAAVPTVVFPAYPPPSRQTLASLPPRPPRPPVAKAAPPSPTPPAAGKAPPKPPRAPAPPAAPPTPPAAPPPAPPKLPPPAAPAPQAPAVPPKLKGPLSRHAIVKELKRLFKVPIMIGGFRHRAAGIFKWFPESIRIKGQYIGHLGVATHEVAHFMDKALRLWKKPNGIGVPKEANSEMKALDYNPKRRDRHEGFAEYIRHLLTEDDAAQVAPKFHEWFQKEVLAKNPELAAKLRQIKALMDSWRRQTPMERVSGDFSRTGKATLAAGETRLSRGMALAKETKDRVIAAWKNAARYLEKFEEALREKGYAPLPGNSVVDRYWAYMNAAPAYADAAIRDGIYDILDRKKKLAPGFVEVINRLKKKGETGEVSMEELDTAEKFAWARQALEMWSRKMNPGMDLKDAEAIVTQYWTPEREAFANGIREINAGLIAMLQRSGVLTFDEAQAILKSWQFYVPLVRVSDLADMRPMFGGKGMANLPSPVKRRFGSGLAVISPLQVTMARTYEFYNRAMKQDVLRELINATERHEGLGGWVDEISPGLKRTGMSVLDIKKELLKIGVRGEALDALTQEIKNAVRKPGMSEDEAEGIANDTMLFMFRPDFQIKGAKPIIRYVQDDGTTKLYQLDEDLFRFVTAMDVYRLPKWADWTWGRFVRMVKMGATALSPTFIAKNAARDFQTYVMQRKDTGWKAAPLAMATPVEMMASYATSKVMEKFGKTGDPFYKLWSDMGGQMSLRVGMDYAQIYQQVQDVMRSPAKRAAYGIVGSPIEALSEVVAVSEASYRMAEFTNILRNRGWTRERILKEGPPPENVLREAIRAAHEVTVDFRRMGYWGKIANQLIPFFNANLEGQAKFIRTWRQSPLATTLRVAPLVTAGLVFWALRHDDDDYKEQPAWLKYGFWTFRTDTGRLIRVPRSYEWGQIPAFAEATMNVLEEGNPKEAKKFASNLMEVIVPPGPSGAPFAALETAMNYDWFRRRPIVGRAVEGELPKYQYTPQTLELSKLIGQWAEEIGAEGGWSPAKIEHFVDQSTGGMYRGLIGFGEKVLGVSKQPALEALPVVSGFTLKAEPKETVDKFYEKLNTARSRRLSAERHEGGATFDINRETSHLNSVEEVLSDLRKLIVDEPDPVKRLAVDKYVIGASRQALGLEPLASYPNPFEKADLPNDIKLVVDRQLLQQARKLASWPPFGSKKDKTEEQRRQEWNEERQITAQFLDRMGVDRPYLTSLFSRWLGEEIKDRKAKIKNLQRFEGALGEFLPK